MLIDRIDEILNLNVEMRRDARRESAMHEYAVKMQNHPYLFRGEERARALGEESLVLLSS